MVLVVLFTLLFSSGCSSNDVTINMYSLSQLQYDYIINTFEEYGYNPSSSDSWIVKHERNKKITIIIKEKNGNPYKFSYEKMTNNCY